MSSTDEPIRVEKVAVVGAGTMGAQIATLTAFSGREVTLFDAIPDAMHRAMQRIEQQIAPEIDRAAMLPAKPDGENASPSSVVPSSLGAPTRFPGG